MCFLVIPKPKFSKNLHVLAIVIKIVSLVLSAICFCFLATYRFRDLKVQISQTYALFLFFKIQGRGWEYKYPFHNFPPLHLSHCKEKQWKILQHETESEVSQLFGIFFKEKNNILYWNIWTWEHAHCFYWHAFNEKNSFIKKNPRLHGFGAIHFFFLKH